MTRPRRQPPPGGCATRTHTAALRKPLAQECHSDSDNTPLRAPWRLPPNGRPGQYRCKQCLVSPLPLHACANVMIIQALAPWETLAPRAPPARHPPRLWSSGRDWGGGVYLLAPPPRARTHRAHARTHARTTRPCRASRRRDIPQPHRVAHRQPRASAGPPWRRAAPQRGVCARRRARCGCCNRRRGGDRGGLCAMREATAKA